VSAPAFRRLLLKLSGTLGENIEVKRFARFEVGAE